MYFLGRQIFSNTLGGDDEVASIRRARDAAACIPGSGRYGAQRCEPRAGVACDLRSAARAGAAGGAAEADAGARRVRDDAAEGRPRGRVLGCARVAWVRGPTPEVCVRGWRCAFGPAGARRGPCVRRGAVLGTDTNATAPLEPLEVMITKSVCEQVV